MSKKVETGFKTKVLKDLKYFKKSYVLKTQERARRGVPDIIGCIEGKFFALELKTDTGKLDELQLHTLAKIRGSKGLAMTTSPQYWKEHFKLLKEYFR